MERLVIPVNRKAAGVAIIYEDMVLLAKRADLWEGQPFPFAGYWSIFGGAIESGETPIECAVREAWEEARIKINPTKVNFFKMLHNENCDFSVHSAIIESLEIPQLNEEHTEYGWFKINCLDSFTEKIDLNIIECIKSSQKN